MKFNELDPGEFIQNKNIRVYQNDSTVFNNVITRGSFFCTVRNKKTKQRERLINAEQELRVISSKISPRMNTLFKKIQSQIFIEILNAFFLRWIFALIFFNLQYQFNTIHYPYFYVVWLDLWNTLIVCRYNIMFAKHWSILVTFRKVFFKNNIMKPRLTFPLTDSEKERQGRGDTR